MGQFGSYLFILLSKFKRKSQPTNRDLQKMQFGSFSLGAFF